MNKKVISVFFVFMICTCVSSCKMKESSFNFVGDTRGVFLAKFDNIERSIEKSSDFEKTDISVYEDDSDEKIDHRLFIEYPSKYNNFKVSLLSTYYEDFDNVHYSYDISYKDIQNDMNNLVDDTLKKKFLFKAISVVSENQDITKNVKEMLKDVKYKEFNENKIEIENKEASINILRMEKSQSSNINKSNKKTSKSLRNQNIYDYSMEIEVQGDV